MKDTNKIKNKIKSIIDAIKKLNDNPSLLNDNLYDLIEEDVLLSENYIGKKIDDYKSRQTSKRTSKKDIFEELLRISNQFITNDGNETSLPNNKLIKYAKDSASTTLRQSKQVVIDTVKNNFFSGEDSCGVDKKFNIDTITISPKDFDFLNMLKVSPTSTTGKIMYESDVDFGYIKMNKELYYNFDSNDSYVFKSGYGNDIFTMIWDKTSQKYIISGLSQNDSVQSFLSDYYSTIEYPQIDNVIKQSLLLTINGDGTEDPLFTISLNKLEILLKKIFSVCNNKKTDKPLNQNPSNQIDEDEEILDYYFDFNDVEGIDIDDEDARLRRVLKFMDCNNFEVPVDNIHIEDFVYFDSKNKNIDENISDIINRISKDSYELSDKSISLDNFKISLSWKYLLNLPKALILSIMSPKIFFPIAVIYKVFKSISVTIEELMKLMSNLFFSLIKKIFWMYIKEIWLLLKKELLTFVRLIASRIIENKTKRIKVIISSLINLLNKLLLLKIESCDEIFGSILSVINNALNSNIKIPIPNLLLSMSGSLPGYSTDRAFINITERLTAAGIEMGPLFGRENKLNTIIKGIIDGNSNEIDTNQYIKIVLLPSVIPAGVAGAVIPPGTVVGYGKSI